MREGGREGEGGPHFVSELLYGQQVDSAVLTDHAIPIKQQ